MSGSSFMNNKELARVLAEAIDAPLGSTKRAKARSMATIMRRTSAKHDGKGGPGYSKYNASTPGSAFYLTKAPHKDSDWSNMDMAQTPAAPTRGNPMPSSAMSQVQNIQPEAATTTDPGVGMTPVMFTPPTPQTADGQGGPGTDLSKLNLSSPFPSMNTGSIDPNSPNAKAISGGFAGYSILGPGQIDQSQFKAPSAPLAGRGNPGIIQQQFPNIAQSPFFTKTQPPSAAAPVAPTTPETPAVTDPGSTPSLYPPQNNYTPGTTPQTGGGSQTLTQTLQSAVNNNLGASGFANQAMQNPALLKEIFPGMQEIPSGTLTESVTELQDALAAKYGIDQLQNQLTQMIGNGVTLGPMLQTYIQNKDVSLNKINKQRDVARDAMLHSDTGNPQNVAIWSRYMDYLDNMYNSQNSSYADFYNKSVGMYNNALTALNTQASNAINQYNNELTLGSQLRESDYNRIYTALTDMYTAMQDAPTRELERAILEQQLTQLQYSLIDGGMSGDGKGEWVAEYKKLQDMGILFDNAKGNEGSLLPNVTNLGEAMNTIVSDAPGIGQQGALYIIGQAFQKSITNQGGNLDTAIPRANEFKDMIIQAVQDGSIPASSGSQMMTGLGSATTRAVSSYIAANDAETAKHATIYALTGQGGGWFDSGKVPTQDQFLNKYKGKLPNALLNNLYLSAQATRNVVDQSFAGGTDGTGLAQKDVYDQFADQIRALTDPQDVGNYVGDMVGSLVGGVGVQALNLTQ